tara:strand:+ start:1402 stop:1623 length:222 start_codon:yes stop_codon:yes gene_type:complete
MLAVLTFATSGLVANGVKPGASVLRASSPVMSGQSGQQIGIPDKCARRRLPPPRCIMMQSTILWRQHVEATPE